MATAGIVEYEPGRGAFSLPVEHGALTTRATGPNNFATYAQFIPMCGGVAAEVVDKFHNGVGVPYSSYPRFHAAMAEMSAAIFDATFVDVTLPLVPGAIERLQSGITAADVGTGSGHAVNAMATAFPNSQFVGMDFSEEALATGRGEAEALGLSNAKFIAQDAAKLSGEQTYDLITTFDAVRDQADPQGMVDGIYNALAPGGHWLCVDIQASSHVGENLDHPMGPFMYGVSCQHCDRLTRLRRRGSRSHVGCPEGPGDLRESKLHGNRRPQCGERSDEQLLRLSQAGVADSFIGCSRLEPWVQS